MDRVEVRALWRAGLVAAAVLLAGPGTVMAQGSRVSDLTVNAGEIPVRLTGYGLVVGLDGTGDRVFGNSLGGMTVRTIANLLRNSGIEIPERVIRSRNAAAVLVTAEASPYTRTGGRFNVGVASLGDATSLRGGQLLTTPLTAGVGGPVVGVAQGNVLLPPPSNNARYDVETSAVLTDAGAAQVDFGGGANGPPTHLLLRDPDLAAAQQIADAINQALGGQVATVEDPGAVALALPQADPMAALVQLSQVQVTPTAPPRVVVDARSGVVAAGGDIFVGPGVVSADWLTLAIEDPDPQAVADPAAPGAVAPLPTPGSVRVDSGVSIQVLAEALHAVGATADIIGAVFRSLKDVGALHAEVEIR